MRPGPKATGSVTAASRLSVEVRPSRELVSGRRDDVTNAGGLEQAWNFSAYLSSGRNRTAPAGGAKRRAP